MNDEGMGSAAGAPASGAGGRERDLAPVTAARLGPERAAQARALRRRLRESGIEVPAWIDERPGRLRVVIGDCASDPPLGRSARMLAVWHGPALVEGLGALALAAAAPRAALLARDEDAVAALGAASRGTTVQVLRGEATWPAQADLEVAGAPGHAWVVPAQGLERAAAALHRRAPRRLCTVAGAVAAPQVVELVPGETPAELVRRCGGATVPAWAAVGGGAPRGDLWEADAPLPEDESMLLVLPVAHELVRRLRAPAERWLGQAAAACAACRICTEACPQDLRGAPVTPHAIVRALALGGDGVGLDPAALAQALSCTGCGVCDAVCPSGLSPQRLVSGLAQALRARGVTAPPSPALPPAPHPEAAQRRLPLSLLTARLGLSSYV